MWSLIRKKLFMKGYPAWGANPGSFDFHLFISSLCRCATAAPLKRQKCIVLAESTFQNGAYKSELSLMPPLHRMYKHTANVGLAL
jgi:hypothetical protein